MATTTNYSWTTPDDTALVKDGASAIRTLGSSVDTTVKNLNPETTLGDISYRSSTANVKTRLGLGTAGQVLKVNSGATAPEWGTVSTGSWTQAATGSLTGGSVVISGLSGKRYFLILDGVSHNNASNQSVSIRLNGDTGSNYALNYETAKTTSLSLTAAQGAASVIYVSAFIDLADTASQYKPVLMQYRGGVDTGGNYISTSAITSITVFPTGGSFDAGTYYVWSFA